MIKMNKSQNYHLVQIARQADGAKSEKLIFGRIHHSMKIHRPCFFILSYQYISTIHQIAMADIRLQKMSIQTLCVYENAYDELAQRHLKSFGSMTRCVNRLSCGGFGMLVCLSFSSGDSCCRIPNCV